MLQKIVILNKKMYKVILKLQKIINKKNLFNKLIILNKWKIQNKLNKKKISQIYNQIKHNQFISNKNQKIKIS